MKNIAHIEVSWYLYKEKVKPKVIATRLGVHRATVYRWISSFKRRGYRKTINYYKNCKKRERKKRITPQIKELILEIREKHKECCGQKIEYYLKRDHGVKVSLASIYRVLGSRKKLRKKYKGIKYGEAPKGRYERDVIQADTVDFGEVYAYTYIDTYTRQVVVDLELGLEAEDGYASLTVAKKKFKRVRLLQNDGGSEFKAKFKEKVKMIARRHRVSRPYKKNEQSFIESFNRTLRKECLGWRKYSFRELPEMKRQVDEWLEYYHNERAHLGLNMKTPNEVAFCRI
jgi:transposase InsO family protein